MELYHGAVKITAARLLEDPYPGKPCRSRTRYRSKGGDKELVDYICDWEEQGEQVRDVS